MRILAKLAVVGIVALAALQLVRPGIPAKAASTELQAPSEVRRILEKDCYSCHSDERRLAWFDQIVPAYWLVRYDILSARQVLNFSTIGSKPAATQRAALYESVNMMQLGAMPMPRFLAVHPEARVAPEDLSALKAYLAPWSPMPAQSKSTAADVGPSPPVNLTAVLPELNGLPFSADFETWKPVTTTDRGDNHTFRFVLGNDIAVKAAQSGNISPWPDGTRFAKIAWQQEPGEDGLIHPGKFVQVEFMLKDAQHYKNTDGWGWGRWRGLDLKPYGADAHFVNECTGCHAPVRGDDSVYSLPMTNARTGRSEVVNNRAAALPDNLPYQSLGWRAITMYVDPNTRTTATLYGDDGAVRAVQARVASTSPPAYPEGAVLALVTWSQRDDPHWFGARIPDAPVSVEFVQVGKLGQAHGYRRFAGTGLIEDRAPAETSVARTHFVLGLLPAQLP